MIVAVRDVPLAYVDVWHETDENGQPTCRHGEEPLRDVPHRVGRRAPGAHHAV